jgi:hypothetical protein
VTDEAHSDDPQTDQVLDKAAIERDIAAGAKAFQELPAQREPGLDALVRHHSRPARLARPRLLQGGHDQHALAGLSRRD